MNAGKRELNVRICFTTACLGNNRQRISVRVRGKRRRKTYFFLPKNNEGRVILLSTWWQAILRKAADVECRHSKEVRQIQFSPEVDGSPTPVQKKFYRRRYGGGNFTAHEAFFPGDIIGVSCLVPNSIDDDDFWRLMTTAGKYYGISPSHPNEYGFFVVENVRPRGAEPPQLPASEQEDRASADDKTTINKKATQP